jgi:NAD(P)H-hydrate epimerase
MFLTREQVREYDRRAIAFGMPGVLLMENAGRGAAELLLCQSDEIENVVVCCGKGNNGGDGFVIARHLDNAGINVEVLLFAQASEISGDAAIMLQVLRQTDVPISEQPEVLDLATSFASANWIVDALFGTGLSGTVRPPFDKVIDAINESKKPILAVDIPSGLDCDTGDALGIAVRATLTATFVAEKVGFEQPSAAEYLGVVHVLDIGAPRKLLDAFRSGGE